MLLGPAADLLADRRLVVVADGALQYLPFAALFRPASPRAAPGEEPELLLARHEVVSLPSASVLAAQREAWAARRPAAKMLAVLADPVFSAKDERLAGLAKGAPATAPPAGESATRARGPLPSSSLPRLLFSRREALAITAYAPAAETFLALDFAANRDVVVSGRLSDYRILHFATHGSIDTRNPALSGLTLSQVDAAGRPLQGMLGLGDIYGLDLDADLVVLSACETALGRQIRGEGLVGLTRGFMYAGAARVLASLWSVRDRSTAELMARFYRNLLAQGRPPAAALREAQLSMVAEARWRDPYHWAAFVLQGDWEGWRSPAVRSTAGSRPGS
jgi:CHAT domain-containing protein